MLGGGEGGRGPTALGVRAGRGKGKGELGPLLPRTCACIPSLQEHDARCQSTCSSDCTRAGRSCTPPSLSFPPSLQERNARFQRLQQRLYQQWPLMQRHTHVVIHAPAMHRRQGLTMAQVWKCVECAWERSTPMWSSMRPPCPGGRFSPWLRFEMCENVPVIPGPPPCRVMPS